MADETDAWNNFRLAVAQAKRKNWESAIPFYRKAIQSEPSYANAYIGLGMALVQLGKKTKHNQYWSEAEQAFQRALSLQPHKPNAKSLAGMANVQWHLGNKAAAVMTAKEATQANSRYMYGWIYLIRFQLKSGQVHEAWKTWMQLKQTGFHFEDETSS